MMNRDTEYSDQELVTLITRGDRVAFELVYKRYARRLYAFARKNISSNEDSEEMVQDVFESLWIRHEDLQIQSLQSYLFSSIRYMIIRHIASQRKQSKMIEHFTLFESLYDSVQDETKPMDEIKVIILRQLGKLPERCQVALQLRLEEDLSNREIAEKMSISKKTVEFYISKALHHLRTHLKEPFRTH